MQKKIRISEFEKELKRIDENVEVVRGGESDYYVKFDEYTTHLCAFVPGTLDNFNIFTTNSYDRGISDKVLYKAIKMIPHLVPDNYKEPTVEELFNEFKEEVEKKGFYLEIGVFSDYDLRFDACGRQSLRIAEFNRGFKHLCLARSGVAPIDKFIEGLELLIKYVKKARSLRHIKLYEIPLPGLITTDGQQQYFSEKDGIRFASRKNRNLKQAWTNEELEEVPDVYREYAVEVEE